MDVTGNDLGVCGFNVYRGGALTGPFTWIGDAPDPYQIIFFDADPALQPDQQYYYTANSFAGNALMSPTTRPILCMPLQQLEVTGPDSGAIATQDNAVLSWNPVPRALSYVVLLYRTEPTYNTAPLQQPIVLPSTTTTLALGALPAGDYWWAVAAYDAQDPDYAYAGSFSTYRKLTISE